jgi:hypothetical protein
MREEKSLDSGPQEEKPNPAKKLWQTPRLTCETEANDAQKRLTPIESDGFSGPS